MSTGRIVIVAYKPKPGQHARLRDLLAGHVPRLLAEGLVTDRAPIVMEAKGGTVVEVFEWVSADAIERAHTNAAVGELWSELAKVCDYVPLSSVAEAGEIFAEFAAWA